MGEWYQNFFHGVALDFWRAAIPDELTRVEADFIEKQLKPPSQAKILDVPCGGGRFSLELARRGFALTGVDISSEFIREAKSKSAAEGLEIEWHCQDMRRLPWRAEFDGAFCFGNSFGYLSDEGNVEFLSTVAQTLKPGARFIVDTGATAESILPNFQPRRWFEIGAITMLIDNRYDHEQGRMFTEYTFIRDGEIDKRPGSQRVYTFSQITALLRAAGLESMHAFSSTDEEPFKLGAQRLLIVAEKK